MAHAISFDTLAYAKKLIEAGVPAKQAEVHAEALAEMVDEQLTTKRDLKELEMRLIIRIGAMLAAAVAIIATLVKLF